MKLELKHIAPYLPYGIQVTYVQRLFGGEKIIKHHNQSIDRIFMDYGFINLHTEPYSKQAPLNDYLLELRPLSDLTKEIENYNLDLSTREVNKLEKLIKTNDTQQFQNLEYSTIIFLCANHYDFQNLIPKDSAIDINTIKI